METVLKMWESSSARGDHEREQADPYCSNEERKGNQVEQNIAKNHPRTKLWILVKK